MRRTGIGAETEKRGRRRRGGRGTEIEKRFPFFFFCKNFFHEFPASQGRNFVRLVLV